MSRLTSSQEAPTGSQRGFASEGYQFAVEGRKRAYRAFWRLSEGCGWSQIIPHRRRGLSQAHRGALPSRGISFRLKGAKGCVRHSGGSQGHSPFWAAYRLP